MKVTELQKVEKAKAIQEDRMQVKRELFTALVNQADWRAGVQNLIGDKFITVEGDPVPCPQLAKFGEFGWVMHYEANTLGYTLYHKTGHVRMETIDTTAVAENTTESVSELVAKPKKSRRKKTTTTEE
jgi:hypothetical protein